LSRKTKTYIIGDHIILAVVTRISEVTEMEIISRMVGVYLTREMFEKMKDQRTKNIGMIEILIRIQVGGTAMPIVNLIRWQP
jgi:hypothetical protein